MDSGLSGVTKLDRIRNERIRGETKVGELSKVPGKRRRGRPNQRWLDNIKKDFSERALSGKDAQDRVQSRRLIRNIDPT